MNSAGTVERPRIKAWFHVEVVPREGVYLLSERGQVVLTDVQSLRLAPFLDGRHTVDEIVSLVADTTSPAEVYFAVDALHRRGYLEDAEAVSPSPAAAFWESLKLDPAGAEHRLGRSSVSVTAVGRAAARPIADRLAGCPVRVADEGDLHIVVTDDYLRPELEAINAAALHSGRAWLLVKPVGTILWVGPVFEPGRTACWECLAQRVRSNRQVESYLQHRLGKTSPFPTSSAALPATVAMGCEMAVVEALKWLAGARPPVPGATLLTLDTLAMTTRRDTVTRRPQCPRCGAAEHQAGRAPSPLALRSSPKRFTADGGHRAMHPSEMVERYAHHVSPYVGAVSELERVPMGEDASMHVYSAGSNFAVRNRDLHFLRRGLRSKSAGKGTSDVQARASAIGEALERYSGIYQGDEIAVRASFRELGARAIHPNACMLYSQRQYRERDEWNARGSRFQVVPEPLDEDAVIDWSPVWSLTRRAFRYLPTSYLYYSYPIRHDQFYCWADSNGNAAGTTLEEAILQGFLELVERDSVALWWYNRVRRPALDLASFADPYVAEMQARYERLRRPLRVLDVTTDLGVPAFVAVSARNDKPAEDILVAFGAHLDPGVALLRAITELNQFLPAVLAMPADGTGEYAYDDPESVHWWKTGTLAGNPHLVPDPDLPPRTRADFGVRWSDDLLHDVLACQKLVEDRGLELLVLDQTRPDIGLPTVKVIVPGLRHFWARYAPGRLYDVPVELGWLKERRAEDELNPTALFL